MRFALVLLAAACSAQVTVKYSLQPSGVFRALAGRQLPARTALYEAVACADADTLIDEGRLLHAAPFSTVSQARELTITTQRSKAALGWRVASLALPLALGGLAIARVDTSILASVGGAAGITTLINGIRQERETVPNVGAWVGADVLMLGGGRCITRLMLGQFPPPKGLEMPAVVTISALGGIQEQRNPPTGGSDKTTYRGPIAATCKNSLQVASFEMPDAWNAFDRVVWMADFERRLETSKFDRRVKGALYR